jgi:hypothetical protein
VHDDIPQAEHGLRHAAAARLLAAEGADPDVVCAHLLVCEPAGSPEVVDQLRVAAARAGLPRVFRTTELVLFHAASGRFRYSSRASCGVLYPRAEWRRVRLYRSSMYRAISSRAFFLVG